MEAFDLGCCVEAELSPTQASVAIDHTERELGLRIEPIAVQEADDVNERRCGVPRLKPRADCVSRIRGCDFVTSREAGDQRVDAKFEAVGRCLHDRRVSSGQVER